MNDRIRALVALAMDPVAYVGEKRNARVAADRLALKEGLKIDWRNGRVSRIPASEERRVRRKSVEQMWEGAVLSYRKEFRLMPLWWKERWSMNLGRVRRLKEDSVWCGDCDGAGYAPTDPANPCKRCFGLGQVPKGKANAAELDHARECEEVRYGNDQ